MMTSWETSGRPRQFMVIAENSRCSILFRLLVTGGRCSTVMSRAASVANAASAGFPTPRPGAFGPAGAGGDQQAPGAGAGGPAGSVPPGADRGDGERAGVVIGAHVDPAGVRGQVVDPVRGGLVQLLVGEVVHAYPLGLPGRRPFRPAVLEVPDILLLLGVHADHRAAVGLERCDLGVDVPELGVAVGVLLPR